MSHSRKCLKTPEEIELDKKRIELARFQDQLADNEQLFVRLRTKIRAFEQTYEDILGKRLAVLEDLEWQLKGLLGNDDAGEIMESSPVKDDVFAGFRHCTDLLDDDDNDAGEDGQNVAGKSLKSLYREVAKAIHPDLALDDEQRLRRQELMALANHAYETGDRSTLEDLLGERDEAISGTNVAMELVRVIRQIARAQQNIYAVNSKIAELKATDIYCFKLRVDESKADGIDLMAEMAAAVDLNIARVRRRLAALRGADETMDERNRVPLETRLIRFPTGQSCGILYERSRNSVDFRDWQRLGTAKGVREVSLENAVRLDVKGAAVKGFGFLDDQQPDDLQALFLYDIDDSALSHFTHLSGLQELYLSNTAISDEGLRKLSALRGLQRLYLYHTGIGDKGLMALAQLKGLKWLTCSGTGISEDGLKRFRQELPGCKAINFEWRHGRG